MPIAPSCLRSTPISGVSIRLQRAALALFLSILPIVSPTSLLARQGVGQLSGVVLSATDGAPVSAATLTIEGTGVRGYSNQLGRFQLSGVPAGTYTVLVERLGFTASRTTVTLSPSSGVTGLELRMTPEPVLVQGVVVSVTGEVQRRVETPASISRVGGAELREVSPTHPAELLNRLPGVWISPTNGEGHMTAIRQPITTNPVYLFLEDGVPTRSPGFFNHNALYEVNVPQADRIEVIRGPGTALYGSDAIGGVIDVATRAAATRPEGEFLVEANDLGMRRLLATVSGSRGVDGLRLDLNLTEGDDWRDSGEYDRQIVTLRWDRSLPGGTSLRTTASYSNVYQSDPSVISRADLDSNPSVNRHPITYRSVEALRIQSRFEHRGERFLVEVTPFLRWNSLDLMPSWLLGFDPVIYRSGHRSLGVLARMHTDLGSNLRLTAGIDLDRSPGFREEDRITVVREGGIAVDWTRGDRIYDYEATFLGWAPYLQLQARPLPKLVLTGGLRWDRIQFAYSSNLPALQTGIHRRPEDTTLTYSNLGPSIGGAYTLSDEVNFFVGYRESFRAPSEGQLFRQGTTQNTVGLKPVRARSIEAGVRGERPGLLAWELSTYRLEVLNDILSYVRPEDGLTEATNAGRTRHQGVEFGLTLALPAGMQTDLSLSRANHTYLEWSPRSTVSYAGNRIQQAPRDLFSARFRSPIPLLNRGQIEVEWMKMGAFWMDPENAHEYEGYALWNLRLAAPLPGNLTATATVTNLFDLAYADRASYNAFRGDELSPGRPRAMELGLRYGWAR